MLSCTFIVSAFVCLVEKKIDKKKRRKRENIDVSSMSYRTEKKESMFGCFNNQANKHKQHNYKQINFLIDV